MLNIIQNTIGAIRRVGESVVRAGLKMWLPFTKAEPLGENVVVNGDFSTDSDWQLNKGATISDGRANFIGDGSRFTNINQDGVFTNSKFYKIVADVTIVSGEAKLQQFGYNESIGAITQSGVHTFYYTAISDSGLNIGRRTPNNSFEFYVNSVSVEEYAQETPDISGNDNNAILKTGKALVFAVNDSVETSFPSSKTIKTIAFWIYPTHSASFETLFNLGITNIPVSNLGDRVIELNHLTIRNRQHYPLNFDVYIDGVYRGETNWNGDNPTLELNQWQRVVFVNSDGTSTVNDTFDIAYTGSGSHGRFKMSDLQIYGADWTTDDIAYDYANPQKLVTDNASSNVTLNDLHAWWHMSEGDGTIAFDSAPLIGKELVVNGDFATDSNWYNVSGTGWEISGSSANHTGGTNFLEQNTDLLNGVTYIVQWSVTNATSGTLGVSSHSGDRTGDDAVSVNGNYKTFLVSNGNNLRFYATGNASISSVSAKEVFNIDGETYDGSSLGATYDDAQERIPQLGMMNWSKGSNLIEYSEDFSEWTKVSSGTGSDVVLTENQLAPDGTLTATKMFFDKGTGSTTNDFSILLTSFTSQSNTASVYLRADTAQKIMIRNSNTFQLIDVSTDWFRINKTDSGGAFKIGLRSGYVSGEPNTSTIYVWGAQAESGTTVSAYRRTNGTAVTDATLISCATDSQKDILGNAVRVKGSGFNLDGTGYAEVPHTTDFDFGTGDFSVSAWVKYGFVNQGSGLNVILSNGLASASGSNNGFHLFTTDGIYFRISNGTIIETIQIISNPTTDNWYHIAITRSGTDLNTYIDNVGTSHTISSIDVDTNFPLRIGVDRRSDRNYSYKIDDVILYDTELSSDEIEQNYNATKSGHNN